MKYFFIILVILTLSIKAEEKLGGQEIIERLDRVLQVQEGYTKATLSRIKGHHTTHFWKVNIFRKGDDVLYTFEINHRRPVAKFLSRNKGSKLTYYNVLSGKFFRIEQAEKLENILHSEFSYLDLSNYQYEANYRVESKELSKSENENSISLKMIPIFEPSYKSLRLISDNANYSPKKIDFTSSKGLLIKTLKFEYGKIKVREGKSVSEINSLKAIRMTDNSNNYFSVLEFQEWNKNIKSDRIFYEMKSMYEK